MRLVWSTNAWQDYGWWLTQDRKNLRRINRLLADIILNGNAGMGRPEPLRHEYQGYRSRRINEEHRLIYRISEEDVLIAACRHHHR